MSHFLDSAPIFGTAGPHCDGGLICHAMTLCRSEFQVIAQFGTGVVQPQDRPLKINKRFIVAVRKVC